MYQQASEIAYPHLFLPLTSKAKVQLANKIIEMAPNGMSKVCFQSGGTEACETAIRMARIYNLKMGRPDKYKLIARMGSYAGCSIATMSLGWHYWRNNYAPYLLNVPLLPPAYCYRCPFGEEYPACDIRCARELEQIIKREDPSTVSAFICEPIPGAFMGAATPPAEYFNIIRQICDKYDVIMIIDEVITGLGRLGRNFGIEHWGVTPDIICCGKGISAGYAPLSAVIASEKLVNCFAKGDTDYEHVVAMHTYAGNPVSCAVGLAVQEYITKHNHVQRAESMGHYLFNKIVSLLEMPMVGDIRGKGLMIGIELVADKKSKRPFSRKQKIAENISSASWKNGLWVLTASHIADCFDGDTILIVPALTITESECDQLVDLLKQSLEEVQQQSKC
jgi:adenosylmethionine-8-amino-7-oxononanoate aminotransferase